MEHLQNLKIAVDFDGTLVEHEYPKIGKDILFAFETLKELQKHGALIILWTIRAGQELDEAVEYCRNKGIEFYAVNKNYPEEEYNDSVSRKINADVYIDDKNVGGFPGWSTIWQQLSLYDEMEKEMARQLNRRKSLFRKLFRKLPGRDKSL
jgi:hydroxymethylpyrimidine pyrophosphatase-like HAD family hydrolase